MFNHDELVSWRKIADEYHSNSKLAHDLEYPCRPLDPVEYLRRSCINAHWPHKILLSVTIELLRYGFATSPDKPETEDLEIELICAILQNRNFKPRDCTEDAVRFHFENFNFPALTHIISKLSQYETKALQEPSTYEPKLPKYDAFKISIQAIMTGELLNKDVSDQPFNMSGLITTLRRIVGLARVQHFAALYGDCPNLRKKLKEDFSTWEGYKEAQAFDDCVVEAVCASAQYDIYRMYGARTWEEITYCQKIFNDVGYHGIWKGAPAPFPWTKESEPSTQSLHGNRSTQTPHWMNTCYI